jgi:hypothetical protein
MKSLRWLVILCLFSVSEFSISNDKNLGAGVMVGSLTSINGKYWFSKRDAMDFGIGFAGYPGAFFYADYLYNLGPIFATNPKFWRETSAYIGGGGGVGFWKDSYECGRWKCSGRNTDTGTGIFLRGFFGMEWMPSSTRFGIFGEAGLTMLVSPGIGTGVDAAVGGRYYF